MGCMPGMTLFASRWKLVVGVAVMACLAAGAEGWWTWSQARLRRVVLPDGSVALFDSRSRLTLVPGFPVPRTLRVDGEFWIAAAPGAVPLVVRSRLMVVEVVGGSRFHMVAWARESGEQVEVSSGGATVSKNYASSYAAPDELGAGEMSMVNRSIDLMEKETLSAKELAALQAAARAL
jgi:ferric-dicitrate binding protein FerR (iron transport regulator)